MSATPSVMKVKRGIGGVSLMTLSPRHCEEPTGPAPLGRPDDRLRDEAIHSATSGFMDCFASLAMTKPVALSSRMRRASARSLGALYRALPKSPILMSFVAQ